MPRYFFNLHECGTVLDDPDGQDHADLTAAHAAATTAARAVMSDEVSHGRLCLSCHIAVEDEQHHEVARVNFRDVVVVTGLQS